MDPLLCEWVKYFSPNGKKCLVASFTLKGLVALPKMDHLVHKYYLLCLKLRTTTYAELPWSLGLSLFPYFWHLQQLGCHSFLIFDIDSSWLTGFCFKKREREKISFLGPKKQTEKPCVSSHTAATGSSLTVCMLVSLHATPHLWPESLMKNLNILAILGLSEPKWWE